MANGSRRRKSPARRKSGGGGNGLMGKAIFGLIILAGIFSFYSIPSDPTVQGLWGNLVEKSEVVSEWATGFGQDLEQGNPIDIGGGGGGDPVDTPGLGTPPAPQVAETNSSLGTIRSGEAENVSYDRAEWNHWENLRSCWTVREQVLADEALEDGTLTLLDSNNVRTSDINKACEVAGGTWVDAYTGETFSNPSDLDVDHMIPLANAARHGGQAWNEERKQQFANDLTYENHLIAVSASANRSKSDRGPAEWKPTDQGSWCSYAVSWVTVSKNYDLSIGSADKAALTEMLATCA